MKKWPCLVDYSLVTWKWICWSILTHPQALCHCTDCRKISGGNYSNNIVVPSENFKVTAGTPKEISKTADSGKPITSESTVNEMRDQRLMCYLQATSALIAVQHSSDMVDAPQYKVITASTDLQSLGDAFGGKDGMRIIKAGILDDVSIINSTKPGAELFAPERVSWVPSLEGAGQLDGMPQ